MAFKDNTKRLLEVVCHPPKYLLSSLVVCVGGLLNGLDTGVIGPVTTMPTFVDYFGELSSTMRGITVSSVLLSATFASLFAGTLSDTMGRTRAVGIGSAGFALGAALEAGATNLGMLIVGRLIVGVGEGLFLSTLVVYICEISPPGKRGILASMVQVAITVGLCIGYFMCYGTVKITTSFSWRFPLAIQAGIALWLAVVAELYLVQSPRWLTYRKRPEEALRVWEKLGVSTTDREEVLQTTVSAVSTNVGPIPPPAARTVIQRWQQGITNLRRLFATDARKPMLLGVFLMSMQQMSGIDGVLYYAPLLFQQAGLSSSKASFLASGVSAILIFLSSIPAFLLADKWGRRASTLYGGIVLTVTMVLIGSLYASESVHPDSGAARWVVIIAIYIFAIAYCMTWALSIKVFASEVQPIATRATATSLSQSANCITNFFVAFITPVLLASSSSAIYFLFAGCSLVTVTVCAILMPETRMESLEKINENFQNHRASDATILRIPRFVVSSIRRRAKNRGHANASGELRSTENLELSEGISS